MNILEYYGLIVVKKDEYEKLKNENSYGFLVQRLRQKENEIKELKRLLNESTGEIVKEKKD